MMARVPRSGVSERVEEVVPSAPFEDVSNAGIVGQSLARFGQTLSASAMALRDKREKLFVLDFMTGISGEEHELLWRKDGGLRHLRGSDAFGVTDKVGDFYKARLENVDNLDQRDPVKMALKGRLVSRRERIIDAMSRFEAEQNIVFERDVWRTKGEASIRDARTFHSDPDALRRIMETNVETVMALTGIPPEQKELMIAERQDLVYGNAIAEAGLTNPQVGLELLEEFKEHLSPDMARQLEAALKARKEEWDVDQLAAEVERIFPGDPEKQWDYADKASGVSESVRQRVKGIISSRRAEQKRREAEAKAERRKIGSNAFYGALLKGDLANAEKIRGGLSDKDFTAQEKLIMKKVIAQGFALKPNPQAEKSLQFFIMSGRVKTEAQLISHPDAKYLTAGQVRSLREDLAKELKNPSGYDQAIKDVETTFTNIFKEKKDLPEAWLFFTIDLQREIAAAEEKKKGRLTPLEVSELGLDLLGNQLRKQKFILPDKRWRKAWKDWEEFREGKFEKEAPPGEGAEKKPSTSPEADALASEIRGELSGGPPATGLSALAKMRKAAEELRKGAGIEEFEGEEPPFDEEAFKKSVEAERQTPEERQEAIALLTRNALALTEVNIATVIKRLRAKKNVSAD